MGADDEMLEFASIAWFDLLFQSLYEHVGRAGLALDGIEFSLCEVITGLPEHLAVDGSTSAGWWLRVDRKHVEAGMGVRENVDYRAEASYEVARSLAKKLLTGRSASPAGQHAGGTPDPAAGQAIPPALARILGGLHNQLASRTR